MLHAQPVITISIDVVDFPYQAALEEEPIETLFLQADLGVRHAGDLEAEVQPGQVMTLGKLLIEPQTNLTCHL
ncbi:hypothetical protein TU77_27425 [Pseudomonas synxantha]|uniref:Uncharacterized protein n=1 Tax=Pseudomonas libanensis TaxID=75588 RepID=A0A0R2YAH2_9PSED|nr:hypothetical protein TU73_13810 [Pseudomonas libanensis]KRP47073.1 hypothetical protein TU77_27425 [Pseudomonas synxantha]